MQFWYNVSSLKIEALTTAFSHLEMRLQHPRGPYMNCLRSSATSWGRIAGINVVLRVGRLGIASM